ncbi:MAG TPA: polysaccharide deacetylase family protein [Candidatus Eremiobacteraceae bacterium]|nr:polysaccharide deacetylase family protein [Candidatus Eremiobacteraceae bacterium]
MTTGESQGRRIAFAIAGLILVLLAVIGLRRWAHHAQLELIPVIVPPAMPSATVLDPPLVAIAQRMMLDVRESLSPPRRPRYAVLTFDDGPYPVATPALLAQLHRLDVPAVFFLIGRDTIEQPALAERIAAGWTEIGNHTSTHPEMATLAFDAQSREVADGAAQIERVTGGHIVYFRPPHGNFNAATVGAARGQGETVALWDVDPGDWRHVTAQFVVDNVTTHARSPAVFLLHNGSTATIDALPQIVAAYRRAGFEFVTLSQLQQRMPLDQINDPVAVSL